MGTGGKVLLVAGLGCGGLLVVTMGTCAFLIHQGAESQRRAAAQRAAAFKVDPSARAIFTAPEITRGDDGGVRFTCHAMLPEGTKAMVSVLSTGRGRILGQDSPDVGPNGLLTAGPFTNKGEALPVEEVKVEVEARFQPWIQSKEVMDLVGVGGGKLPKAALRSDDPDLPPAAQTSFHAEEVFKVNLPPLSAAYEAIHAVKTARLTLPDKGRSASAIQTVVEDFAKAPGFVPKGWSATQLNGLWTVSLACTDGDHPDTAQWSFDPKTRQVKYLNKTAKLLSWEPDY